jgi:hypothetical protein
MVIRDALRRSAMFIALTKKHLALRSERHVERSEGYKHFAPTEPETLRYE